MNRLSSATAVARVAVPTSSRLALFAAAVVGLSAVSFSRPGYAQDMTFSVDETGQPPAPAAEGPPSDILANALRLYNQERYPEAAVNFQRVVEGETQDAPANVEKAQFFLGKCLYHLRFYQSALAVFDEISQHREHTFFDKTLPWLAQLASQLPEPAGIIEKVGRYGADQLQQFNTAESADLYNQLLFLMGRFKYGQREFDEAVQLFGRVNAESRWYVHAKFFEGITHIRLRHANPAIDAFRAVIAAVGRGARGVENRERMRDLAQISLARVLYTAANRENRETGERDVDGRVLGAAVEAWDKVSQQSEYWLDAIFEETWAFFLADEYARALGNVHTLYSPYFTNAYYPEALVIKAIVFFANCQIENSLGTVRLFREKYDPVRTELEGKLAEFRDGEGQYDSNRFYQFLLRVRSGEENLSPRIRGIVTSALSDRDVLRHLEYVRVLDGEESRLNATPQAFSNSSLGVRIRQDIAIAKAFAVDQAGNLARGRYTRLLEELQDLASRIDAVEVEALTVQRGELSAEAQEQNTQAARAGGGNVEVDDEHQLWPFDGEYWRDELGYYRQQVTFRCGR